MKDLSLTRVEGLSIGALPLPAGWTTDVTSHVVPCCVRSVPSSTAAPQQRSPSLCYEGTMNVVRCESRDRLGNTIYFTEYFRPRLYDQTSRSAAQTLGFEDMEKVLQAMPPFRPERPPLLARVVEVTDDLVPELPPSRQPRLPFSALLNVETHMSDYTCATTTTTAGHGSDGATAATPLEGLEDVIIHTPVDCIAARLLPSYHIFLQVVLDTVEGPSREMQRLADRILSDAKKRYLQPLSELEHLDEATKRQLGDVESPARQLDRAATEEEQTTLHLRQACSPLTLSERSMPLLGMFMRSARTVMGFRRLYTTRVTASVRTGDGGQRTRCERVDVSLFHTHWNVGRQHGTLASGAATTPTEALRRVVKHGLKLCSEDLVVEIPLRMLGQDRTSEAMLHPVALATLPVAQHPLFSLYNYRSVEAIFTAHVATRSLVTKDGWSLEGIPFLQDASRFVPSQRFVEAVERQCPDSVLGDEVAKVRYSENEARDDTTCAWERFTGGSSRVPPRCSFYLFMPPPQEEEQGGRSSAATTSSPSRTATTTTTGSHSVKGYVIGLVAPRVQSGEAIVVVTPLHPAAALTPSESTADANTAAALDAVLHATCTFLIDEMLVTTPLSSDWGHLCRITPDSIAGAVFRQGELVLEVPAGDARYRDAVVVPTAAYYFTTRGSLTVYASPSVRAAHSVAGTPPSSPALSPVECGRGEGLPPFLCMSAVWTVVADGRSAAEYIDYTISEYQYDMEVKNLSNVGARSDVNRPGMLVVRKRKKQPARVEKKSAVGPVTTAPPVARNRAHTASSLSAKGTGESWSVWLDVGTEKRLFMLASECSPGQLLIIQGSLPAAAAPKATQGRPQEHADEHDVSLGLHEQEEQMLEEWVRDVPVAVLPRL